MGVISMRVRLGRACRGVVRATSGGEVWQRHTSQPSMATAQRYNILYADALAWAGAQSRTGTILNVRKVLSKAHVLMTAHQTLTRPGA